jgi:hypothetical protein
MSKDRVTNHVVMRKLKGLGVDVSQVDCRYLSGHIKRHPSAFPDYMRNGNYVTELCLMTGNWVHVRGNTFTKQQLI